MSRLVNDKGGSDNDSTPEQKLLSNQLPLHKIEINPLKPNAPTHFTKLAHFGSTLC